MVSKYDTYEYDKHEGEFQVPGGCFGDNLPQNIPSGVE